MGNARHLKGRSQWHILVEFKRSSELIMASPHVTNNSRRQRQPDLAAATNIARIQQCNSRNNPCQECPKILLRSHPRHFLQRRHQCGHQLWAACSAVSDCGSGSLFTDPSWLCPHNPQFRDIQPKARMVAQSWPCISAVDFFFVQYHLPISHYFLCSMHFAGVGYPVHQGQEVNASVAQWAACAQYT